MLVLSRKQCEQIQIGDRITITILKVKGHAVHVGIAAPDDVKILRGELSVVPTASAPAKEFNSPSPAPQLRPRSRRMAMAPSISLPTGDLVGPALAR